MKGAAPRWSLAAAAAACVLACLTLVPLFPFLLPDPQPRRADVAAPAWPPRPGAKVLVFILDGVGARVSFDPGSMPLLQGRLRRAAYGIAEATFPTLTPAGLRAIMSGRRGLPEPEFPDAPVAHEPDSVLRQAELSGLSAVAVGQQQWPVLFAGHGADISVVRYRGHSGEDYDAEEYQAALRLMRERRGKWSLFVIHFFGSDPMAHIYGTQSPVYRAHLREQDRFVDALAREAGPRADVIVTSDHGQMPSGAHGGITRDETDATLVLWGRDIAPGPLPKAQLRAVAPTIAALLGLRPPLMSEEEPLYGALALTDEERDRERLLVFEQKSAQWAEVKKDWPWLAGDPKEDLARAESLARAGRWARAGELSKRGARAVEAALLRASPNQWYGRFILAEALLVLACGLLALGRFPAPGRWGGLLAAAVFLTLAAPCLNARFWHWSAAACAAAAAVGLLAALRARLKEPARDSMEWLAFAWGIPVLALPSVVDVCLWSWLALAFVIWRRAKAGASWKPAAALLAFAWWMGPVQTPGVSSVLRVFLPFAQTPARWVVKLPIGTLIVPVCALLYSTLPRGWSRGARAAAATAAGFPFLLSAVLARWAPGAEGFPMTWAVIGASLLAWSLVPLPRLARCLWLSLLLLAYHQGLAVPGTGARLMAALVLGWALARDGEKLSPLWRALELAALTLWSYSMAGYTFDFSQISVSAGYATLGSSWHPYALIALISLRQWAALGLPVLPLLAALDGEAFAAAAALAGAWSCGSLLSLWTTRFWGGLGLRGLASDEFAACALWTVVTVWSLAAWRLVAAFKGFRPPSCPEAG